MGTAGGSRRLSVAKSFAVNSFDDDVDASLAGDGSLSGSDLPQRLDSIPEAEDDGRETVRDVAEAAVSSLREPYLDSRDSSSGSVEPGDKDIRSRHSEGNLESTEVEHAAESDEGWFGWVRGLIPWGRKAEQAQDSVADLLQVPCRSSPPLPHIIVHLPCTSLSFLLSL